MHRGGRWVAIDYRHGSSRQSGETRGGTFSYPGAEHRLERGAGIRSDATDRRTARNRRRADSVDGRRRVRSRSAGGEHHSRTSLDGHVAGFGPSADLCDHDGPILAITMGRNPHEERRTGAVGAGERTARMTEELALKERLRNPSAALCEDWFCRPRHTCGSRAPRVPSPCRYLLK